MARKPKTINPEEVASDVPLPVKPKREPAVGEVEKLETGEVKTYHGEGIFSIDY